MRRPPGFDGRNAPLLAVAATTLVAAAIVSAGLDSTGPLTPFKAVMLGVVEGVTEFLPVSSTGHLLVTQRFLGLGEGAGKTAADTYAIAIQLGAIVAVVALYRQRLVQICRGVMGRDDDGRSLFFQIGIAFTPAATVGLVFGDRIKSQLFGPWPVILAWFAGGLMLLAWTPRDGTTDIEAMTQRHALIIGTAQILALWPGTSRSLVTIAAALAIGMTMSAALEFSFLLGLVTLSAATMLDLSRSGDTLVADYGIVTPLLGAIVAFVTAHVAVRWLVTAMRTQPLSIFGWYRIGIAIVTIGLIGIGII